MAGEQRDVDHQFVPQDYFAETAPSELFSNGHPMELDIGCGDGRFLIEMARQHPERNFLGLERLLGRVRKVCRRARQAQLDHVKVLRLDSQYALEYLLPQEGFARIHLLFPDPWPKKRHHRRRLFQGDNLPHFARVLAPGGEFLFKTDDAPYFEAAMEAITDCPLFRSITWDENAFPYPLTDFEKLWLGQGKTIQRARFVKV